MKLLLPPAKSLSDRDVAQMLYQATGAIGLILDAVEGDPLGIKARTFRGPERRAAEACSDEDEALIARIVGTVDDSLVWVADAAGLPGTAKWHGWTPSERRDWWIGRVGAITTVGVAYPGIFGVLVQRLPIQTLLGFGQQAVLLCAVARAYGIDDRHQQSDLLADVLCRRSLDARALLDGKSAAAPGDEAKKALVKEVWTGVGKSRAVIDELERRPSSKQPWRLLGALPVVGALASYIGESGALRRASEAVVGRLD